MKNCRYERDTARWFDGQMADGDFIEAHLAECPHCAAYLKVLERTRAGVSAHSKRLEIADESLPAYLQGLRAKTHSVRSSPTDRWWALASLTAAALLVAISVYAVFSKPAAPVEARTVVESISTGIDGATATVRYEDDGTTTVWVNVPDGDMW